MNKIRIKTIKNVQRKKTSGIDALRKSAEMLKHFEAINHIQYSKIDSDLDEIEEIFSIGINNLARM